MSQCRGCFQDTASKQQSSAKSPTVPMIPSSTLDLVLQPLSPLAHPYLPHLGQSGCLIKQGDRRRKVMKIFGVLSFIGISQDSVPPHHPPTPNLLFSASLCFVCPGESTMSFSLSFPARELLPHSCVESAFLSNFIAPLYCCWE